VIANTRAGQITIFRSKCSRAGRYRVQHLIEERRGNANLIDWLDEITRLSEEASPQYERSMRGSLPTFTIICGLIGAVAMAQDKNIEAAKQGAENWLAVVDKGDYAASYDEAASIFKLAVTKEDWLQKVRAARSPLGKVVSHKWKHAQYKTSLPGAPDGEYVVIQYETSFDNKRSAVETITPTLDKDARWRVSGYYIR
jgi:hypothetical protein